MAFLVEQASHRRDVTAPLSVGLFGEVVGNRLLETIGLQREQALVHCIGDALGGQTRGIGPAPRVESDCQRTRLGIERIEDAAPFERQGLCPVALRRTPGGQQRSIQLAGDGGRQALRPEKLGDPQLLIGHEQKEPQELGFDGRDRTNDLLRADGFLGGPDGLQGQPDAPVIAVAPSPPRPRRDSLVK